MKTLTKAAALATQIRGFVAWAPRVGDDQVFLKTATRKAAVAVEFAWVRSEDTWRLAIVDKETAAVLDSVLVDQPHLDAPAGACGAVNPKSTYDDQTASRLDSVGTDVCRLYRHPLSMAHRDAYGNAF